MHSVFSGLVFGHACVYHELQRGLSSKSKEMVGIMVKEARLLEQLHAYGYRATFVGLECLALLQQEVDVSRRRDVSSRLYELFLHRFQYSLPPIDGTWQSILLVAAPQKVTTFDFAVGNERCEVVVPPTYIRSGRKLLEQRLHDTVPGIDLKHVRLPLKLMAARSGIGRYGRNNLLYVDDFGSFNMLFAYYTNIEITGGSWAEPVLVPACHACSACINNCPTGCIEEQRFLIHAERCLTTLNELEGEFPDWLNRRAHNALIGCMRCQDVCPANSEVLGWREHGASFSAEETQTILAGVSSIKENPKLCEKLESLDLWAIVDLLPRNLGALLS